jgi:hypothetical protein
MALPIPAVCRIKAAIFVLLARDRAGRPRPLRRAGCSDMTCVCNEIRAVPAAMLHYALAMASRGRAAGAAGAVVILGAVGSALINEVGHGWQWWAGAGAAVLAAAGLTFWLALRPTGGEGAGDRLDRAAVKITGSVTGSVETLASGPGVTGSGKGATGDQLGPGAVLIAGDVGGSVRTKSFGQGPAREGDA